MRKGFYITSNDSLFHLHVASGLLMVMENNIVYLPKNGVRGVESNRREKWDARLKRPKTNDSGSLHLSFVHFELLTNISTILRRFC